MAVEGALALCLTWRHHCRMCSCWRCCCARTPCTSLDSAVIKTGSPSLGKLSRAGVRPCHCSGAVKELKEVRCRARELQSVWSWLGQEAEEGPPAQPEAAQTRHLQMQLLLSSSSLCPMLQPHWNDPGWFWHVCSHPPLFAEHSSTSTKQGTLQWDRSSDRGPAMPGHAAGIGWWHPLC